MMNIMFDNSLDAFRNSLLFIIDISSFICINAHKYYDKALYCQIDMTKFEARKYWGILILLTITFKILFIQSLLSPRVMYYIYI